MPRTAPQAKKDAVRGYGGTIIECEPSTSSREAVFAEVAGRDRRRFRASLQRSARDRRPGHLLEGADRGCRRARCGRRPDRRRRHDLGHLPDAFEHSRREIEDLSPPSRSRPTTPIAASRRATSSPTMRRRPSPTGFKVPLKELHLAFRQEATCTDMFTASEQEIIDAMKLTWKRMKIVMEPSSAVPLATILKNPRRLRAASASASSSPAAMSIWTSCPG